MPSIDKIMYEGTEYGISDAKNRANIAAEYSASSTYNVGDVVLYNGQLYKCTTAITTAEAWTAAHWTAVTVGGELSNLKEDFHEYHSELGAGYADQLVSGIQNEDSVPYNFRKVPYDATLEKVDGIVGVDVVLNQLVDSASIPATKTESGITFTNNGDGTITVNGTASADVIYTVNPLKTWGVHKYMICGCPEGGSASTYNLAMRGQGADHFNTGNGNIWDATENTWKGVVIYIKSGATVTNLVFKPNIFDLTQTFGSQIADYAYSLEQSTAGSGVAWLKKNFPKIFNTGYVPYNAGTMVHVSGLSAKKTVGFNLFDESLDGDVIGNYRYIYITIGETNQLYMGLKEKDSSISLTGVYFGFFKDPANAALGNNWVVANGFMSGNHNNVSTSGATGELCGYVVVYPSTKATFDKIKSKYNICINLSDPAKNGTYEPYTEHTYPLDSSIDLHGILKLDSNNNLYADGDMYKPDGSVSSRYDVVDLGTLDWNLNTGNQFYASIPVNATSISDGKLNVKCSRYLAKNVYVYTEATTNGICTTKTRAWIVDTAYTSASALKASLSGVMLVYEKETPTTEQAEPYTQTQICDPNGTEEYISDTVAPVGHVTKYPLDIAGRLDNILTMPTADGTYTLRATVNNGKVTYSWVSA